MHHCHCCGLRWTSGMPLRWELSRLSGFTSSVLKPPKLGNTTKSTLKTLTLPCRTCLPVKPKAAAVEGTWASLTTVLWCCWGEQRVSAAHPLTEFKVRDSECVKGGEQHTPPGALCSQIHALTFGITTQLTSALKTLWHCCSLWTRIPCSLETNQFTTTALLNTWDNTCILWSF